VAGEGIGDGPCEDRRDRVAGLAVSRRRELLAWSGIEQAPGSSSSSRMWPQWTPVPRLRVCVAQALGLTSLA